MNNSYPCLSISRQQDKVNSVYYGIISKSKTEQLANHSYPPPLLLTTTSNNYYYASYVVTHNWKQVIEAFQWTQLLFQNLGMHFTKQLKNIACELVKRQIENIMYDDLTAA